MYHRVGTYNGPIPLLELAGRLGALTLCHNSDPGRYSTTTDHLVGTLELFSDIAPAIPGTWVSVMGIVIPPAGSIPLHADLPIYDELIRYHLVVQTNPGCESYHDGTWQHLESGGIYSVDPTRLHESRNTGDTDRIHLVIDVVPALIEQREAVVLV